MKLLDGISRSTVMRNRWNSAFHRSMLDLVFPPNCLLCQNEVDATVGFRAICDACVTATVAPATELCRRCGRRLTRTRLGDVFPCRRCEQRQDYFDRVVCLGPYQGLLREAIVRMKHAGQQSLTAALGVLLAQRTQDSLVSGLPDLLLPVPMHWSRRLLRGVGSTQVLAETMARVIHLPVSGHTLRCCRKTQKQSTLTPGQRKENVRGAFCVPRQAAVANLHVGIIDDTFTTGATSNEAARVLRQAGAKRVSVLVLARASGAHA